MRDLEGATAAREGYIQEEIPNSFARERGLWQRERERGRPIPLPRRERGQLQVEIGQLHGYKGVLIGEIRGHRMPLPPAPHILSRYPHIH